MKNFKSLYGFGGRCLKIRDICMDFEPYLKVHNLVSLHPKSIILGQMINLDMIVHVVVSVYRLLKICNSPQFPAEFRNGLLPVATIFPCLIDIKERPLICYFPTEAPLTKNYYPQSICFGHDPVLLVEITIAAILCHKRTQFATLKQAVSTK